jgi:drug/metabolite transporter (DMT)-like permease
MPDRHAGGRPGTLPVNGLLFMATAILWGASAIVTGHQASSGSPAVSVCYRMALVSVVMLGWCLLTGTRLAVGKSDRPWVALQGVLFFGLSFIAFYQATTLIPSGLAALVLSTSSLIAAVTGFALLSTPITSRLIAGLCLGTAGLAIVVLPQVRSLAFSDGFLAGIAWAAAAAASTGIGTVVAARNQRRGIPLAAIMGWSALAGAIVAFAWASVVGADAIVDFSMPYILGLLYLAILASCLAFFMYFSLVERIGPGGASYTLSVVPLVALALSAVFEGLSVTPPLVAGGIAIGIGNILVMNSPRAAIPKKEPAVPTAKRLRTEP